VAASGSTPTSHTSLHVMDPLNKVFSSHQTLINLGASASCSANRASCLCGQGRDPRLLSVFSIAMFSIFPHLTSIPTLVNFKPLFLLCVLPLRQEEASVFSWYCVRRVSSTFASVFFAMSFEMSLKFMWNCRQDKPVSELWHLTPATVQQHHVSSYASFFEAELHQLRREGISKVFPPMVSEEVPQPASLSVAV
jgi:hypothetical protein